MRQRLAVVDEHQLLLRRIAPQQIQQRRLLAAGAHRRPPFRQRTPVRCVGVARGKPLHRRRRGRRRRSRGGQQVMQRQPVPPRTAVGGKQARQFGEIAVSVTLAGLSVHPYGRGMAARQPQRHGGTGVADHRVAHQFAQAFGIGRPPRLARRHVGGAEFLERLEDARLQQCQEVVELGQVVLHRRRRQQQQKALVQPVHQLVALAGAVAEVVRLVDDDEVEVPVDQPLGVLAPACHRQRGDQPGLAPEALGIVAQQRVVGAGARDVELVLQLFAPLPDERRRHQHQHALGHAAQQVFLQHHPGLDGLAEPDLVRQQHPAAEPLQHLAHALHLVGERFDAAQMRKAQQFVETLRQAEMAEPLPQSIPATVRPRRAAASPPARAPDRVRSRTGCRCPAAATPAVGRACRRSRAPAPCAAAPPAGSWPQASTSLCFRPSSRAAGRPAAAAP